MSIIYHRLCVDPSDVRYGNGRDTIGCIHGRDHPKHVMERGSIMAHKVNNHQSGYIDEDHGDEYGSSVAIRAELDSIKKAYNDGVDIRDEVSPDYRRGHAYRDFL